MNMNKDAPRNILTLRPIHTPLHRQYESCMAETNGTAAFYFMAKAGEAEARTFALPEVSKETDSCTFY